MADKISKQFLDGHTLYAKDLNDLVSGINSVSDDVDAVDAKFNNYSTTLELNNKLKNIHRHLRHP